MTALGQYYGIVPTNLVKKATTIADLRDLPPDATTTVVVDGYTASGDGGGGSFYGVTGGTNTDFTGVVQNYPTPGSVTNVSISCKTPYKIRPGSQTFEIDTSSLSTPITVGDAVTLRDYTDFHNMMWGTVTAFAGTSMTVLVTTVTGMGTDISSTTNLAVGLGAKTFVVNASATTYPFVVYPAGALDPNNQWVLAYSAGNPANYMKGQITSYTSGSTPPYNMVVNVTEVGGLGNYSDWVIVPIVNITSTTALAIPVIPYVGTYETLQVQQSSSTYPFEDSAYVIAYSKSNPANYIYGRVVGYGADGGGSVAPPYPFFIVPAAVGGTGVVVNDWVILPMLSVYDAAYTNSTLTASAVTGTILDNMQITWAGLADNVYIAPSVLLTSSTNLTVPVAPVAPVTVSTTFDVGSLNSQIAIKVGDVLQAKSASAATDYMQGRVTAYAGSTITIAVETVGGSGTTHADWQIGIPNFGEGGAGVYRLVNAQGVFLYDVPAGTSNGSFVDLTTASTAMTGLCFSDNGGTVILPTGGDGTTAWLRSGMEQISPGVLEWRGEAVNVKWFGATGDGATDDTSGITYALALGKDVYFPNGTYKVKPWGNPAIHPRIGEVHRTSGWLLKNGQTVFGNGEGSKLEWYDDWIFNPVNGGAYFPTAPTLYGPDFFFGLRNGQRTTIKSLSFVHAYGSVIIDPLVNDCVQDTMIRDCYFTTNLNDICAGNQPPLDSTSQYHRKLSIIGCIVESPCYHSMTLSNCYDVVVSGNIYRNVMGTDGPGADYNGGFCCDISQGSKNVLLVGNVAEHCKYFTKVESTTFTPLYANLSLSQNVTIADNVATGIRLWGIYLNSAADNISITGNVLKDFTIYGITYQQQSATTQSGMVTASNNVMYGNMDGGAVVTATLAPDPFNVQNSIMTVTGVTSGALQVGQLLSGAGVYPTTKILNTITGSGGVGTYQVSTAQTIAVPITVTAVPNAIGIADYMSSEAQVQHTFADNMISNVAVGYDVVRDKVTINSGYVSASSVGIRFAQASYVSGMIFSKVSIISGGMGIYCEPPSLTGAPAAAPGITQVYVLDCRIKFETYGILIQGQIQASEFSRNVISSLNTSGAVIGMSLSTPISVGIRDNLINLPPLNATPPVSIEILNATGAVIGNTDLVITGNIASSKGVAGGGAGGTPTTSLNPGAPSATYPERYFVDSTKATAIPANNWYGYYITMT